MGQRGLFCILNELSVEEIIWQVIKSSTMSSPLSTKSHLVFSWWIIQFLSFHVFRLITILWIFIFFVVTKSWDLDWTSNLNSSMKIHRAILKRLRSKTPWNNTRAMKGDPIYSHHEPNNSLWISQKANAGVYLPSVRCKLLQSKPLFYPLRSILPILVLRFFSRAYICWYLFLPCRHWKQTSSALEKKKKKNYQKGNFKL